MFIQLWQGLRDLYQDNKTTVASDNAKRFINWSVQDISNGYDWEFLRGTTSITPSADGEYSLNPITQISGATANIYAIPEASADSGVQVIMYGDKLIGASSNPEVSSTYTSFTLATAASASSSGWSNILSFYKPVTNGVVYITNGTAIIATLGATDTYIANDFRKIDKIIDSTNSAQVYPIDYATELMGNPSGGSSASTGYDFMGSGKIRFFGVTGNTLSILYQRMAKWLVMDYDRTEFPRDMYQDIIDYAYRVYGKQFQDEATAISDAQITDLKKILIGNMISKWVMGGEYKPKRILPRGYVRRA